MKVEKTWLIISGIIFVVYNFMVFFIGGFEGHSSVYWSSYVMALLTMICVFAMLLRISGIGNGKKVLFLGYSVFVWSGIFLLAQLVITTVFMIVNKGLKVALAMEVLLLAAYIVITLTCFKGQDIIQQVQENRTVSVNTMKNLRSQLGAAVAVCKDQKTKQMLEKLKEEFEYSDSVSSIETAAIEEQMLTEIQLLKNVCQTDTEQCKNLCDKLTGLLRERNVLCQSSKKRY